MAENEYMCTLDRHILSVFESEGCALGASDMVLKIGEMYGMQCSFKQVARHMKSLANYNYLKTWIETPPRGGQKRMFELVSA